jgi:hypothetical protein
MAQKVKWINCPKCGHPKSFKFKVGQIWMNDRNYKVQILDFGFEDVWLLYLDNGNKVSWKQSKFLEQYVLMENKNG